MTNKEREILDWEFEEMLRNLVSTYLKLCKFDSFQTSLDTHKEIYDIKITKRKSGADMREAD